MEAKPRRFGVDIFALIAHFQAEPGGARVESVLDQARREQAEVFLSTINYGELIHITEIEHGLTAAQNLVATVDQMPAKIVDADCKLTPAAAHLKPHYPIVHADAFALALARERRAMLLTGDPEFLSVQHLATIEWMPRP